jgi:amino acid transporter
MTIWWDNLNAFQQTTFVIASIATVIMFIFLVLMFFGLHDGSFDGGLDSTGDADFDPSSMDHPDFDASIHGDSDIFNHDSFSSFSGLKLFTLRGILAFLSVGSWVAFLLNDTLNPWLSTFFGILSGGFASFLLAYAFKQMWKLESEGNVHYENAIGKTGTVYIKVPANKQAKGKVNLTLQERYIEVDAITSDLEDIIPGSEIVVVGVESENTIIVRRK